MADFAQTHGVQVEKATFEDWQPAGRRFDTLIAAQSWHWVDPIAGAMKATEVVRPRSRLAIEPFTAAYRRVVPDSPFGNIQGRLPLDLYQVMYAKIADTVSQGGHFQDLEQWRFDWEKTYTRDQWLALLPTTGGLTQLLPDQLTEILAAVGAAIDTLGRDFTMEFTTLAASATRGGSSWRLALRR